MKQIEPTIWYDSNEQPCFRFSRSKRVLYVITIESNTIDAMTTAIRCGVFSGSVSNARRILRSTFAEIRFTNANTMIWKNEYTLIVFIAFIHSFIITENEELCYYSVLFLLLVSHTHYGFWCFWWTKKCLI